MHQSKNSSSEEENDSSDLDFLKFAEEIRPSTKSEKKEKLEKQEKREKSGKQKEPEKSKHQETKRTEKPKKEKSQTKKKHKNSKKIENDIDLSLSILPKPFFPTQVIRSLSEIPMNKMETFIRSILIAKYPSIESAAKSFVSILNSVAVAIWSRPPDDPDQKNLIVFFLNFSQKVAPAARTRFLGELRKEPELQKVFDELQETLTS